MNKQYQLLSTVRSKCCSVSVSMVFLASVMCMRADGSDLSLSYNSSSAFRLALDGAFSGTNYEFYFSAYLSDYTPWVLGDSGFAGTPSGLILWDDMQNGPGRNIYPAFHAAGVADDSDGDLLSDGYEEFVLRTRIDVQDSNTNGVSDADEDFDADGLTNLEEYLGTLHGGSSSPMVADTDGDGICDGPDMPPASGLTQGPDAFPLDPAGSEDRDNDGKPDSLHGTSNSSPPLQLDDFTGSLPNLTVYEPTTTYPFPVSFNPPVDTNVAVPATAPEIYEYSRNNNAGDTIILTGGNFSKYTDESFFDTTTVASIRLNDSPYTSAIRMSGEWTVNSAIRIVFSSYGTPSNGDRIFDADDTDVNVHVYYNNGNFYAANGAGDVINLGSYAAGEHELVYDSYNGYVKLDNGVQHSITSTSGGLSTWYIGTQTPGYLFYPMNLHSMQMWDAGEQTDNGVPTPFGTFINSEDDSAYFLVDTTSVPVNADRSITNSGEEGQDTRFIAFGTGATSTCDIVQLAGMECAVNLPDTLPSDETYMLWPANEDGAGRPVVVNQTETWWVGPGRIDDGEQFHIFGRNLGTNCYAYVTEVSTWLQADECNPYKATFTLPPGWANGTYTIWAHNGKGGKYGWAKTNLTLEVHTPHEWDGITTNAMLFATVQDAVDAVDSGDTIYFPSNGSPYEVSAFLSGVNGKRFLGDTNEQGAAVSIIMDSVIHNETPGSGLILNDSTVNFMAENIYFQRNSNTNRGQSVIRIHNSSNIVFNNCHFDYFNGTMWSGGDPFSFAGSEYLQINGGVGVSIGIHGFMTLSGCSDTFIDGMTIKLAKEASQVFFAAGMGGISVENCTIESYDDTPDGHADGRWFTIGDTSKGNYYLAGNVSIDAAPPYTSETLYGGGGTNAYHINTGEQIMPEGGKVLITDTAIAGTLSAITLTVTNYTEGSTTNDIYPNNLITIVDGKGYGQTRQIALRDGYVYTMTENWNVAPDSTSKVAIHQALYRAAIFDNILDGRYEWVTNGVPGIASRGGNWYAGAVDTVWDSNSLSDFPSAITLWPVVDTINPPNGTNYLQLHYFNSFINNTCTNMRTAIQAQDSAAEADDLSGGTVGLTVRGNIISNITGSAIQLSSGGDGVYGMVVIESNFIYDVRNYAISEGVGLGSVCYIGNNGEITNAIWSLAFDHQPTLFNNDFGMSYQTYVRTENEIHPPGALLHIPQRNLVDTNSFDVWNVGTAPLSWTSTGLLVSSGSIPPESSTKLTVSGTGVLTIISGTQTNIVTVK